MIRYELKCPSGHSFESWFRDSHGYDEQVGAGQVACPVCGDLGVTKAPMAPALGKARAASVEPVQVLRALRRQIEAQCENVGTRFAEEARKIHYGEVEPHGIYGDTTPAEAEALTDEGIAFGRIPWVPATDS